MSDLEKKQREVDENYDAFLEILPQLMKKHEGKFALMRHKEPVEFFDTTRDALIYATKTYKDGLYSVQEVTQKPIDLGWFSHAPIPQPV